MIITKKNHKEKSHRGIYILPNIFTSFNLFFGFYAVIAAIKYNSFKKPELFKKMNFNVLVSIILILIFIAAQPSVALFFLALTYVVSGPLISIKQHKTSSQTVSEVRDVNEQGSSLI